MRYEFDQLLEDLWDGRLDEEGRRRLDELCAADPRLAARYRQERNLTGLLKRCGPNHAPDDMARSVMARLETRVRIRPVRPWYWWMMEPAFRAAFAAVVLVALGVQIGVLIANKKERQVAQAPLTSTPVNVALIRRPPEVPDPEESHPAQAPTGTRVAKSATAKRLQPTEGAKRKLQYTEPMVAMNVPKPTPEPVVEPFPTPSPGTIAGPPATGRVAAFPNGIQPVLPAAAPAPTATPKPAIPEVRIKETAVAQAKAAPLSLADRAVAMQITLNPNALPLPSAAADANRPASEMPSVAESFAPQNQSKPRQTPLTHKDIETALFAVPGVTEKDVTYGPVPGDSRKWQVRARLTPVQFRSFIGELRKTGIEPSPSVKAGSEEDALALRSQPPSGTRNMYDLTQGRQWLQPLVKPRVSGVPAAQPAGTTSTVKAATNRAESAADEKLDVKIVIDQVDGLLSTR